MASAPPDGTAGEEQRGTPETRRKMPEIRRGIPENTGNTQKNTGEHPGNPEIPECRNAGEGGREMPGNRLKSNQPQY